MSAETSARVQLIANMISEQLVPAIATSVNVSSEQLLAAFGSTINVLSTTIEGKMSQGTSPLKVRYACPKGKCTYQFPYGQYGGLYCGSVVAKNSTEYCSSHLEVVTHRSEKGATPTKPKVEPSTVLINDGKHCTWHFRSGKHEGKYCSAHVTDEGTTYCSKHLKTYQNRTSDPKSLSPKAVRSAAKPAAGTACIWQYTRGKNDGLYCCAALSPDSAEYCASHLKNINDRKQTSPVVTPVVTPVVSVPSKLANKPRIPPKVAPVVSVPGLDLSSVTPVTINGL